MEEARRRHPCLKPTYGPLWVGRKVVAACDQRCAMGTAGAKPRPAETKIRPEAAITSPPNSALRLRLSAFRPSCFRHRLRRAAERTDRRCRSSALAVLRGCGRVRCWALRAQAHHAPAGADGI